MDEKAAIRPARPEDGAAIDAAIAAAFGQRDEADLVAALEANGDVVASLVAETEGGIVGHVLLSRMEAPFPAVALAPLAVRSDRQGQGIGTALVHAAIEAARWDGCHGIFVLGDPVYYRRFGFSAERAQPFGSPYAGPYFMLLPLASRLEPGPVVHAPAFARLG